MNEPCETPKMDPNKTVIENLTWILEHAGICEIGASNESVASYMKHWEGRTEKAESEVTALKQELAQMRESHVPRSELEAESRAVNQVAEELAQAKERIAHLEKRLDLEGIKGDVIDWCKDEEGRADKAEAELHVMEHKRLVAEAALQSSKEKLVQMTTAFLTTEDALHNSKKALAALEGKLGEMRKVLKDIMEYLHDTDELGEEYLCPTAKVHYENARAALEPIKKEEAGI